MNESERLHIWTEVMPALQQLMFDFAMKPKSEKIFHKTFNTKTYQEYIERRKKRNELYREVMGLQREAPCFSISD